MHKIRPLKSKELRYAVVLILLLLMTSGCGQVSGAKDFTLAGGETVPGPLFLFSNNATLEGGSKVAGPVLMLCCNLTVDGEVGGNILRVSGNLRIGSAARIDGNVQVMSGNVAR
jgi:hypothetical protein